jgi:hypothetical protein
MVGGDQFCRGAVDGEVAGRADPGSFGGGADLGSLGGRSDLGSRGGGAAPGSSDGTVDRGVGIGILVLLGTNPGENTPSRRCDQGMGRAVRLPFSPPSMSGRVRPRCLA